MGGLDHLDGVRGEKGLRGLMTREARKKHSAVQFWKHFKRFMGPKTSAHFWVHFSTVHDTRFLQLSGASMVHIGYTESTAAVNTLSICRQEKRRRMGNHEI